ncbi:polysaccharide deacetylase family protein [Paenibacillus larvae]
MNMKISRNNKRRILSLGVTLAIAIILLFVIQKFTFIIANGAVEENTRQGVTQQQNQVKDSQTTPAKPEKKDGKPAGKVVYLTFDDGPSKLTGQFLDVLKEHGIKATFFMIGNNLKNTSLQKNVQRAVKEGHYVGGHSMTHDSKKLYDGGQFVPEMKETLSLIHDITGTSPKLVRPPYGSAPGLKIEQIRNQIAKAGIKVWDWTIDSKDWSLKDNPKQIVENIKKATTEDLEVVLMHEKPETLQVLPEIIAFYKQKGYQFAVYNDADHFHLNFLKDNRL